MQTKFYVIVASGPVVVACNSTPLARGLPIGYKAYVVQADDKPQAKEIARQRFKNNEPDDKHAWK